MAKMKPPKSAERRTKMPSPIDAIMAEIEKLDDDERQELIDRIDEEYSEPSEIPDWHIEILKQRLANAKRNPQDRITLEEHMKRIEKRK